MTTKIEERFWNMAKIDLQAIKEKIRQLESGSSGTVGSEVSTVVGRGSGGTFARQQQEVAVKLNDLFLSRRVEFKGWVTDYKQCRYQRLTDTKILNLINDLRKMVPDTLKKYIDWEKTRNEQGTWPTKIMVSLWLSNEANLLTRVGLPDITREELKKGPYKQKCQVVSSRFELSPKKKQLVKAHVF